MRRWVLTAAIPLLLGASEPQVGRDTMKSRLGSKASDEQRVNDCKVPEDKRGERSRPGCAGGSRSTAGD